MCDELRINKAPGVNQQVQFTENIFPIQFSFLLILFSR